MLYSLVRFIVWVVFKLFWRLEIQGEKNIPATGPVIIAPNHRSYTDPPIVGISLRRKVHFLAKRELFDFKPFGWFISRLNAHPLSRAAGAQAIRTAETLLNNGEIVIIFPEGGRSKTEQFRPAKAGVGLVATRTGASIIPAYIHNSHARSLKQFKKVSIVFGKPIDPSKYASYESLAGHVMASIRALKEAHPHTH